VRQCPVRPNEVTGVAVRIFLQIILMLGLGLPEWSGPNGGKARARTSPLSVGKIERKSPPENDSGATGKSLYMKCIFMYSTCIDDSDGHERPILWMNFRSGLRLLFSP
jgi:hypothetical protein